MAKEDDSVSFQTQLMNLYFCRQHSTKNESTVSTTPVLHICTCQHSYLP